MSDPIPFGTCLRLNERRHAQVVAAVSDEHETVGSGSMGYMAGAPWVSKAVAVDLEEPLTPEDAARIVDFYRQRGVPPVLELTAYSHEETFEVAARAGFGLRAVEHVLSRKPAHLDVPPPDGVTIQRLDPTDEEAVRRYAQLVCSALAPLDATARPALVESSVRSQRSPNAMGFFAGLPDGEPVAAAGMEITSVDRRRTSGVAKVAALWGTTVLPPHRRRGIQQALIAHRLATGLDRGCTLAVIESRPGISTERNAARLGFRQAYARLTLAAGS